MKLYNDYKTYLKTRCGCNVYRIGLDAGFSCPTRDGTKGYGGCLYCNDGGSRSAYTEPAESIAKQLSSRIDHLKRTKGAAKFIAYFQAFTNTYGPPAILKKTYDQVTAFSEIVGISIGTRPDTIDDEKARLIASYADRYEVWVELGLQSAHNKTLEIINRGHTFEDFLAAFGLVKKTGIPVSVHVILGLPGETRADMLETAKKLSDLKVDAVKIHLLHVLRGSPLEKLYNEKGLQLLTQSEYVELVCDFLEHLSPDIIIQRLTGEGSRSDHLAPMWALDKIDTINRIGEVLKKRGTCQGFRLMTNDKIRMTNEIQNQNFKI